MCFSLYVSHEGMMILLLLLFKTTLKRKNNTYMKGVSVFFIFFKAFVYEYGMELKVEMDTTS
jgi:hypothetical protein